VDRIVIWHGSALISGATVGVDPGPDKVARRMGDETLPEFRGDSVVILRNIGEL
jgi:hypothetical protein